MKMEEFIKIVKSVSKDEMPTCDVKDKDYPSLKRCGCIATRIWNPDGNPTFYCEKHYKDLLNVLKGNFYTE